jgi:O-antigen ligase
VAVVAMAAEQALGYPLRRSLSPEMLSPNTVIQSFNRGMTVVSLVAFPAILLLWRWRRPAALAAWLATAAVIVASPNGSAVLGILAGTAAAALAYAAPRAAPRILAVVAALLVLGAPFAARTVPSAAEMPVESSAIPGPAHHRLMIWRFTAERIFDRPILGWGYDSSRVIPGREFSFGPGEPALPLHPHNVPLQWWLELGAPGAALGAALLAAIALTIGGRLPGRSERAAALGLFAAALAPACLSYGAWQGWWIGTLGLSAAFMAAAAAFPVWNGSKKA